MALPSSGPLSLGAIGAEFGKGNPISLGQLYGVAGGIPTSGTISIGQFYSKSAQIDINISNTVNPNINTLLTNAGWDGQAKVRLIVNAGTLVNTLVIPTRAYPRGIELHIGAGAIVGGERTSGTAIYTRSNLAIYNSGSVRGGGGDGGEGGRAWAEYGSKRVWGIGGYGGRGEGFAPGTLTITGWSYGSSGSTETYSGAVLGGQTQPWATGGSGDRGGAWGTGGVSGDRGTYGGSYSVGGTDFGYPGGRAGYYIDGTAYTTWPTVGERLGGAV